MSDEWVRSEESARRIRERTDRYSTEAKYKRGEPALLLDYYEYEERERLACPECRWSGLAGNARLGYHEELFDVSCPNCTKILLIVGYPTLQETKDAAAAGNAKAISDLAELEQARAREADEKSS